MNHFSSISIEHLMDTDTQQYHYNDAGPTVKDEIDCANDIILFTLLREAERINLWQSQLIELIAYAKSSGKTVILIVNSWYRDSGNELQNCGADEIFFLDFFLLLVYIRLLKNKESALRDCWDSDLQHWLFLMGKPNKKHRLPLLHRFDQENLLDRCNWSLFVTDGIINDCKQYLPNYDDQSATEWLQKFSRNPDDIRIVENSNSVHYSGIPYGDIYKSCLFQVVSETHASGRDNPWITEKTWLPIINRCPFLIFGNPGTNAKLKKLGFYTFDEFLFDANFDESLPINLRIDSLVKNIQNWLKILSENSQPLNDIIEQNYFRLIELAEENIQRLEKIHQKYQLEKTIFDMVEFIDKQQYVHWRNFYERIRDPDWPDCDREEDFNNLPDWIQKECIEVFSYCPFGKKQY